MRHVIRRALAVLLTVASAGCDATEVRPSAPPASPSSVTAGPSPTQRTPLPSGTRVEDLAVQFRYDASAPIDLSERATAPDGTLVVRDIEFASPGGGRARAYLITSQTSARLPAMVFVAGSNQRREEIRDEALSIARRGIVALVLEQSQIATGRSPLWTLTTQDREEAIQSVVDAQRAIDLLIARTDVDRTKIGFYGFSYGAWLGAMTAAVDKRVGFLVLRSGGPQILSEIARASTRTLTPEYTALMATVDQMSYAPSIAAQVLVQNGSRDTTYTSEQMRAWQERIGGAKTVKNYDAGHSLDTSANADALTWIAERWRLP